MILQGQGHSTLFHRLGQVIPAKRRSLPNPACCWPTGRFTPFPAGETRPRKARHLPAKTVVHALTQQTEAARSLWGPRVSRTGQRNTGPFPPEAQRQGAEQGPQNRGKARGRHSLTCRPRGLRPPGPVGRERAFGPRRACTAPVSANRPTGNQGPARPTPDGRCRARRPRISWNSHRCQGVRTRFMEFIFQIVHKWRRVWPGAERERERHRQGGRDGEPSHSTRKRPLKTLK